MKKNLLRLCVSLGFVVFTSSVLCGERMVAGMIIGLDMKGANGPEVVSITETKPAKLLMPLYDGEQIYVNSLDHSVKVKINDQVAVISSANSPLLIKAKGSSSSVFSRLTSWVDRMANSNGSSRVINAASRGGACFDVRFLNVNSNSLTVRKKLNFEVEGGVAPYRVHFLSQSGQKIISKTRIKEPVFSLEAISLYPNDFSLVVCDSSNCRVYPITVVRNMGGSKILEESDGTDDVAGEILQGLSYLEDGDANRLFEAYQLLSTHKRSNDIAQKILLNVN